MRKKAPFVHESESFEQKAQENHRTEKLSRVEADARRGNNFAKSRRGFAAALLEHMVVPTFVLGADCRVLIWNQDCGRLTGIKAADVIGTSSHWRGFYDSPRPCLADLVALDRRQEVDRLYEQHVSLDTASLGVSAEN